MKKLWSLGVTLFESIKSFGGQDILHDKLSYYKLHFTVEFILVVDGEMDGLLGSGMRMLTGHIDTSSFHGGTISSYIV